MQKIIETSHLEIVNRFAWILYSGMNVVQFRQQSQTTECTNTKKIPNSQQTWSCRGYVSNNCYQENYEKRTLSHVCIAGPHIYDGQISTCGQRVKLESEFLNPKAQDQL